MALATGQGPPIVQAHVLLAAVAGVACATASDGGGSHAGPPVAGPPVAQASVLAGFVPMPAHVAKAPALAAEVGASAPTRKSLTKRAKKSAAIVRVVSARAKNVAAGTVAVAVTA